MPVVWGLLNENDVIHNCSETEDDTTHQVKRISSAGILPFSVSNNKVYFLLGKEGFQPQYYESDKWSDFAGKLEVGESIVEGASREFYQETAGCVTSLAEIRQRLYEHDFLLACDLHPKNVKSTSLRTYLIAVPFLDYPSMFRRTKQFVQYIGGEITCIEKTHLSWFEFNDLKGLLLSTPIWHDKYKRQPKLRKKFVENMRRIFMDPTLFARCIEASKKQRAA